MTTDVYPIWFEKYKEYVIKWYGGLEYVPLTYHPDYDRVVKTIKQSFNDRSKINYVLWDGLVRADKRIRRSHLSYVYEIGWEDCGDLKQILKELVNETPKPFDKADYL